MATSKQVLPQGNSNAMLKIHSSIGLNITDGSRRRKESAESGQVVGGVQLQSGEAGHPDHILHKVSDPYQQTT